jgi:dTDP-glucose 4,6-dehydratase
MKILVTGGCGFIGSTLVKYLLENTDHIIINVDKLSYASSVESLNNVKNCGRYFFEKIDICDTDSLERVFRQHFPESVIHLAAESHVDRSIDDPLTFIKNNINGTAGLLEVVRKYLNGIHENVLKKFRLHHVSTDEVYGSLGETGLFNEASAYRPNSPYAASKASSDHLVRAWCTTYDMPVLITNSSNNYGPYQYPEKLIPLMILNALEGKELPVYGDGKNVRDWIYVEDHVRAIYQVFENGDIGSTYNIGAKSELTNTQIVMLICELLQELKPEGNKLYKSLIKYVSDRPGHDKRYALDTNKINKELAWKPSYTIEDGLRNTVIWYLENRQWCLNVMKNKYSRERLGLLK